MMETRISISSKSVSLNNINTCYRIENKMKVISVRVLVIKFKRFRRTKSIEVGNE